MRNKQKLNLSFEKTVYIAKGGRSALGTTHGPGYVESNRNKNRNRYRNENGINELPQCTYMENFNPSPNCANKYK